MPENFIAVGGALVVGILLGWLFTRGGSSKQAQSAPPTRNPQPVAASPQTAGLAEERRAASADLASLRRRLSSAETALRELRRGA